jgi:hypothetical protein
MAIPTGGDNPSRYKPNAEDDRASGGSAIYLSLATAIEETDRIFSDGPLYASLDLQTRRNIRTADSALRRAAFLFVLHAK